jgi:hypothetical protein
MVKIVESYSEDNESEKLKRILAEKQERVGKFAHFTKYLHATGFGKDYLD